MLHHMQCGGPGYLPNVQIHKQWPPSHSDRIVEQETGQSGLAHVSLPAHHNLRSSGEGGRWKGRG